MAVAVDGSGNAYDAGQTVSTDFPTTPGSYRSTAPGGGDVFVMKLTPTGTVAYSTYLGAGGGDQVGGIAVDSTGAVYVAGSTQSPAFPTTAGAFPTVLLGAGDAFLVKLARRARPWPTRRFTARRAATTGWRSRSIRPASPPSPGTVLRRATPMRSWPGSTPAARP
ncbi:MAG: SBBP repeat-containing protein [Gemmataceae bacterium]|nr:SBBP repeat-containing protein [Gemmataceae bacterium]